MKQDLTQRTRIKRIHMRGMTYKKLNEPDNEHLSEIANGLNSFGLEQTGGEAPNRIAIVCENRGNNVVGGAIGHSIRQRFYLTQLWVSEEHRTKGIGSELVTRIEAVAKEKGCRDIVVDTLNAKSVLFYERLGFRVYMVNPNYIRGFDWHFLVKEIGQSNTALQPIADADG